MSVISPNISEDLECTICLEISVSPIQSCVNGHLVCAICFEKVKTCGICKESLQPNGFVERLARKYEIEVSCRNKTSGCSYICKSFELTAHRFNCEYRPIQCFEKETDECKGELICFTEYCNHLKDRHKSPQILVDKNDSSKFCIEFTTPIPDPPAITTIAASLIETASGTTQSTNGFGSMGQNTAYSINSNQPSASTNASKGSSVISSISSLNAASLKLKTINSISNSGRGFAFGHPQTPTAATGQSGGFNFGQTSSPQSSVAATSSQPPSFGTSLRWGTTFGNNQTTSAVSAGHITSTTTNSNEPNTSTSALGSMPKTGGFTSGQRPTKLVAAAPQRNYHDEVTFQQSLEVKKWRVVFLEYDDKIFLIHGARNRFNLFHWITVIGGKQEAEIYKCNMQILSPTTEAAEKKIVEYKWTLPILPTRNNRNLFNVLKGGCFAVIHNDTLKLLWEESKSDQTNPEFLWKIEVQIVKD